MNRKTEQLVLLLWTFSALVVDIIQMENKIESFWELIATSLAITVSGALYYLIGLAILKITNGLYKLTQSKQSHIEGGK